QSHLFSKSCTVRRFLWAVLIIDLLYNNPQPSRFKLGAYNFQFGMTVKESGKNHLADNCLYDRLSRVLEKPGPLIRAIQLFKPTSRRTPLKLPGVNDNQQIQIFGGCPNWFVNRIVIGIALDAGRHLNTFEAHVGILLHVPHRLLHVQDGEQWYANQPLGIVAAKLVEPK